MSDQATAPSLPASMLAPTSNLEKEFQADKAGMADAEKLEEKAIAEKGKAIAGEAAELGRQRQDIAKFSEEHPFPHPDIKPWTAKPPENDPMKGFGSWASAFGILAGAITKTGLKSSLNASAAAINAFRKNDMDAYHEAKDAWKDNTEIAIKQAEWESKGYQVAFQLMETDHAAGMAQAQAVAAQADNQAMIGQLRAGNLKEAWGMAKGLADFSAQGPDRLLKSLEYSTKMEDAKARAELMAKWTAAHPDATPEEAAQKRTQIMSPQYTINQAKTLAEGAGAGAGSMANDPVTLDYWAKRVRAGEPMPSLGIGKDAATSRRLIAQKAAHDAYDEGGSAAGDMVKKATLSAEKGSLTKLVAQANAIHQFEQTATANGRVVMELADKVDSTGSPVLERWIRGGRKAIAGDVDVTKFDAQLGVYLPEVAKILSNPNMTGVLSDAARAEAETLVNKNFTAEQIKSVIPLLEQDFGRRDKAIKDEIGIVQQTIEDLGNMKPGDKRSSDAEHPPVPAALADKQDLHWSPSTKKFWWKENGEDKSQGAE